ncbi:MAG: DUF4168 domain-containing protein [Thermostichus sp. DG_1_6_bins_120]
MGKCSLLMGLLLSLGSLPAWAQGATPLPTTSPASGGLPLSAPPSPAPAGRVLPTPGLTAEQVTDEQVEQLVQILLELDPLIREASDQLRETQDEEEYEQIMQRTESQASRIVEEQGLTVLQYRELMTLANENPVLNQRIRVRLQELIKEKEADSTASPKPAATP